MEQTDKITIAHIMYSYLPVTQNWIYNQIKRNDMCRSVVICQYVENLKQFPLESIYPVYKNFDFAARCGLFLSRLWLWNPVKFFNRVIREEKPSVIHGHFSHESWRVLPVALRQKIPLVTTFYGVDVNKLPKRKFWKKRYPLLFKHGALFIVEGHFMRKQLIDLGCPQEKVKVVHLGVDRERIDCLVPNNTTNDSVKILFIGLEREKKGPLDAIEVFIKTVAAYPKSELHVIGNGKYRAAVEERINQAGIADNVVLYGFVNVGTYLQLLVNCDIVLAPSCTASDGDTEGGAPVVLLEAQAAGKPVVSTMHCDIPEVVVDGVTGFLSSEHDIEKLSANLIALCEDKELRIRTGKEGKMHIGRNHDLTKQVQLLNEMYHSLI